MLLLNCYAKKILVTRAIHQSAGLCELIEQQGWQAVRFPLIEIQATQLSVVDKQHIHLLEQYHYVFFISVNAVNFALKNIAVTALRKIKCVAVGKVTLSALSVQGINNTLLPSDGSNSEAVLRLSELQQLQGKSCLIVRGEGGRELLADSLRERGALVDYLEVYKRVLPKQDTTQLEEDLLNESLAAIVIYSGDALNNLLKSIKQQQKLLSVPLIVISQRVQEIAQKIGFKRIIIAEQASDQAMINALLNGEECD